MNTGNIS